jgi:hypothetical protein
LFRHAVKGARLDWEFESDGEMLVISPCGPLVAQRHRDGGGSAFAALVGFFEEGLAPTIARGELAPIADPSGVSHRILRSVLNYASHSTCRLTARLLRFREGVAAARLESPFVPPADQFHWRLDQKL